MRSYIERLRARWGGGIRPSVGVSPAYIERWDRKGDGPARCISVEGFGFTANIFIGRTPDRVQ